MASCNYGWPNAYGISGRITVEFAVKNTVLSDNPALELDKRDSKTVGRWLFLPNAPIMLNSA